MDGIVIKDEEACELAVALVELTGQSLQEAVVLALREGLERAMARRERHERIMAITREIARGGIAA